MATEIVQGGGGNSGVAFLDKTISMNDVVAIVTSRAETQLNATIKEKTASAKSKEAEAAKIKKETVAQNEKEALALVADRVEALKAPLAAFGGKVKTSVSSSGRTERRNDQQVGIQYSTVTITILQPEDDGKGYNNYRTSFSETLDHDEAKAARFAEADRLLAEAEHDQEVAVDARRKVANLGTIERQARAKLAEKHLAGIEGGEALVGLLTSDMQDQIAAIGGV